MTEKPISQPRYIAIARDIDGEAITITVVDLTDRAIKLQLDVDWDNWRPASAGHRLIEHGYMTDPAAHFTSGAAAGWSELPGIGHIAPVNALNSDAPATHGDPEGA